MSPTQNPNESDTSGAVNPNPSAPETSPVNPNESPAAPTPDTPDASVAATPASPTTPADAADSVTPVSAATPASAPAPETPPVISTSSPIGSFSADVSEADQTTNPAGGPTITQATSTDSIISAPRKSRASTIIAALVLLLALGGAGAAYFLLSQSQPRTSSSSNTGQIQADLSASNTSESLNTLRLKDNSLSDFDLTFLRLQNEQATNQNTNIVYSPLSMKYALAMLSEAANGESKTEIDNLIGDYHPTAYLDSANRSFANALFVNSAYHDSVKSTYAETLQSKYYAEVREDAFAGPQNINSWVSNKTLGLIPQLLSSDDVNANTATILVNALGIDMEWQRLFDACINRVLSGELANATQCTSFSSDLAHENYTHDIVKTADSSVFPYSELTFNGQTAVKGVQVAATANRYNLIQTLGEETVRSTVQKAYDEWVTKTKSDPTIDQNSVLYDFNLDDYIKELNQNYGAYQDTTDFYYYLSDYEQVFAKDLKEYDGTTLQYVAIMPLPGNNDNTGNSTQLLTDYVKNLQTPKLNSLISSLKPSEVNSFKDGVVTTLDIYLPVFNFNYDYSNFSNDLKTLGISKVFEPDQADLSGMFELGNLNDKPFIKKAIHSANIDFSNNGIKAAAATAIGAGLGGASLINFDYKWDVPVETITLKFDSPFLFLIRDKSTGEIWFAGEVFQP